MNNKNNNKLSFLDWYNSLFDEENQFSSNSSEKYLDVSERHVYPDGGKESKYKGLVIEPVNYYTPTTVVSDNTRVAAPVQAVTEAVNKERLQKIENEKAYNAKYNTTINPTTRVAPEYELANQADLNSSLFYMNPQNIMNGAGVVPQNYKDWKVGDRLLPIERQIGMNDAKILKEIYGDALFSLVAPAYAPFAGIKWGSNFATGDEENAVAKAAMYASMVPFGVTNPNTAREAATAAGKIAPIVKSNLKDQFIAGMDTGSMMPLFKAKDVADLENKLAKLNLTKDEIKTFKSFLRSGYDSSFNYIPQKVGEYYTFDPFELFYANRSEINPIAKKLGLKMTRNVGETPFTYEELVQNGELVPGIYDQVYTGAHGDFISANNMPDDFFNTYRRLPRGLRANQAELDAIAHDNPAGRSGVFIHTHPGDLSIDSHPLGMHFGTKMGNNFIPIGNPESAEMISLNEFGSKNLINASEKDIDLADQLFNGRVKIPQPDGTYKVVSTPEVKPVLVDSKDGIHKVLRFKSSDPSLPAFGVDLQVRTPQEVKSIIDRGISRFNTKFNVNYPMSEIMPASFNNDVSKIWGTGTLGTYEGLGIKVPKIHGLTFALGGQTQKPPKNKPMPFSEWFKQVASEYYNDSQYKYSLGGHMYPNGGIENTRAYKIAQEAKEASNYYDNLINQVQQIESSVNNNEWQSDMTGEWERGDFKMLPFTNVGQYTYNWNPKGVRNRDLYSTEQNPIKLDYANVVAKAPVMTSAQKEEMGRNIRNWVNRGLLSSANLTPEQREAVELVNIQDNVTRRPGYDWFPAAVGLALTGTMGAAFTPQIGTTLFKTATNPLVNAALTAHGIIKAPKNIKEGIAEIKSGNYGKGALDLGLTALDVWGGGMLLKHGIPQANRLYKNIRNLNDIRLGNMPDKSVKDAMFRRINEEAFDDIRQTGVVRPNPNGVFSREGHVQSGTWWSNFGERGGGKIRYPGEYVVQIEGSHPQFPTRTTPGTKELGYKVGDMQVDAFSPHLQIRKGEIDGKIIPKSEYIPQLTPSEFYSSNFLNKILHPFDAEATRLLTNRAIQNFGKDLSMEDIKAIAERIKNLKFKNSEQYLSNGVFQRGPIDEWSISHELGHNFDFATKGLLKNKYLSELPANYHYSDISDVDRDFAEGFADIFAFKNSKKLPIDYENIPRLKLFSGK